MAGGFAEFFKTYSPAGQRASHEARENEKWEAAKKEKAREEEWNSGRQKIIGGYTTEPIFTDDGSEIPVQVGTRPKKLQFNDQLRMIEDVAAHDFKFGKLGAMDYKKAGEALKQFKAEGMLDAHRAFVETGDMAKAAEVFNAVGDRKVNVGSLRAVETEHPAFGKYLVYSGTYEDGKPFSYDPVKAAAVAGGAKGYLEHMEKTTTASTKKQKDADDLALKTKETNAKVGMYNAHARLYAAGADDKAAGGKSNRFEFKPVDQARISTQVAARMQKIDPVSNKEVDHDATPEAIGLAGEIYKESKGEIGIDQAVALVARKDAWMSAEEAEKQARADLKKMDRKGLLGGGDVVLSKGKGGDKTVTADAYVKTRKQELLDKNRQEIRERARKMAGIGGRAPAAAGGLPRETGSANPKISAAARSVLEEALGE